MNGRIVSLLRSHDLRRKLFITLGLLLVFRVGSMLPAPGVSYAAVHSCVGGARDGIASLINLFSGGALLQLAVFSLGVMPYITASIIIQLLTGVTPRLAALKKDGASGQAKLTQYTRYSTVALAIVQAAGLVYAAGGAPSRLFPQCHLPVLANEQVGTYVVLGAALVAGTVLTMWMGEQITAHGIGNGAAMLMLTSIAAHLPAQVLALTSTQPVGLVLAAAVALLALIAGVVFVEQAQRRLPVTYSHKQGSSTGGGTYLPLKVNQAGIVPAIFASSLLYAPVLAAGYLAPESNVSTFIRTYLTSGAHPVYIGAFVGLVLFFSFFYVTMTYDPSDQADQLRQQGAFIPGHLPGAPTTSYLDHVLTRLTAAGSVYLAAIGILPLVLLAMSGGVNQIPLGGTSVLILVGVGLETVKQIDAQVMQRRYPAFLSL